MSTQDRLRAYRHLYRAALKAVCYASPARYEVRDILRESFRSSPATSFNSRRVENTLLFLKNAGLYNGYEHKILKNLLHLKFFRDRRFDKQLLRRSNSDYAIEARKHIWLQYRATLTMLNESLDICLAF
ncbi:hypothetical protein A1O3_09796 [Capronia epimyces CBS 606.96]|uniref:Uncharacterized protein n=1 Tax=Capronia epimyces CBS 606.96 TaxID=1182542 RepID=W9Y538_9EURO|nr:uncharacterized protein A1O3_09796 [Capronia epimyces CBS 606.96]EXJ77569.1 hypothetical protein A1O3_09796 [Capronia epimyces CBS 606.96]